MKNTENHNLVVGDIIELECISKGVKGDGVFKKDGLVIFAPKAVIGNTYRLKLTRILNKYAFAEVV